ncbi:hypothetical protein J1N35_011000 [Gossypium stocksii]|uniref:2-C-methyl-D-erythritol 2,4-cyclodiphosphate synthase domain-containing protein n=1 Tax=Gossypium stocksii TaxID=47602 RepID=A0A9D4AB37_9ROSI|nr:hypothetical protein J1N35_011000 [Gossypium stocksii]
MDPPPPPIVPGDVLLLCVVDAILRALGLPDIRQIFPDSDPKWQGAAASVFIKEAVNISLEKPVSYPTSKVMLYPDINLRYMLSSRSSVINHGHPLQHGSSSQVRLMHEAGYEIGNLDATLILQRPKLSPHKEAIKSNLSQLLGADPSVVNLKAKTNEKVDSLGENRSIAAHTVVLLMRK